MTESRTIHTVQRELVEAERTAEAALEKARRGEIPYSTLREAVDRYKALAAESEAMVRTFDAATKALRPYMEDGATMAEAMRRAEAAGDRRALELAVESEAVTGGALRVPPELH